MPHRKKSLLCSFLSFFLFFILITPVNAQSGGVLSSGDAAVTGFSGVNKQAPSEVELIDLGGPSLRVISLPPVTPPGMQDAPKRLTVTARDIGQVFGVAIDNQNPSNIYVAATSAYGLAIEKDGTRIRKGEPGAKFIPGLFGPQELEGGPNSIWRIDGKSGKVSLFANVTYQNLKNVPASLGALTFDPDSQQLFVSDRATGLIHSFSLEGTETGVYDHGADGLAANGQAPHPFNPATVANIQKAAFDSTRPETYGYAPSARRVYGLAVDHGRLFYSVAPSQIWSVSLAQGKFGNDARMELDVPDIAAQSEIASINFDDRGRMYVAERGATRGDADFLNVAEGGQNRVLRFSYENNQWKPYQEYAIGMPPDHKNADGGVDLNCDHSVWATGERLLETDQPAGNFPLIDGLQGTKNELVKPANVPPTNSAYVNYYDYDADPGARGHMGAVAILKICTATPPAPGAPPPVQPPIVCPGGTFYVNGVCLIPPICPPGTIFLYGECVYEGCPCGYVRIDRDCVPPPEICDYNEVYVRDHCVPIDCPPYLTRSVRNYCHCPDNTIYRDGRCVPQDCPPRQVYRDGRCVPQDCPGSQIYRNGRCVPPTCPTGTRMINGRCVPPTCPSGRTMINGTCVPPPDDCGPNQTYINGHCVTRVPPRLPPQVPPRIPPRHPCGLNQVFVNGHCVTRNPCRPNQVFVNGRCITKLCKSGQTLINGVCVPKRPPLRCGKYEVLRHGVCVPVRPSCPTGQVMRNGRCVPILTQPPTTTVPPRPPIRTRPVGIEPLQQREPIRQIQPQGTNVQLYNKP